MPITNARTSLAGHIASLLVRFALANKGAIPHGWGPRVLVQCGVPHPEVWDLFNEMYESQVSTHGLAKFDPALLTISSPSLQRD